MNIKIARKLYRAGLTVDEIAEALKLSTTAVRNLLTAEIYDAIECNRNGVPLDSTERTIARERGDESHIVVSRQREDSDTNPHPNDDDAVQRRSRASTHDSQQYPQNRLPESEEDEGIPLTFDNPWQERMHKTASPMPAESSLECVLLMIYSQIKRLADAVEKATDTTLIVRGDRHE